MIDDVNTAGFQFRSVRKPETKENKSVGERSQESERSEDYLVWYQRTGCRRRWFRRRCHGVGAVSVRLEFWGRFVRPVDGGQHREWKICRTVNSHFAVVYSMLFSLARMWLDAALQHLLSHWRLATLAPRISPTAMWPDRRADEQYCACTLYAGMYHGNVFGRSVSVSVCLSVCLNVSPSLCL